MKDFSQQEIQDTLTIIDSTIVNCEKMQLKLKVGSSYTLTINRIKAFRLAKSLLMKQEITCTKQELEQAIIQITSVKNKSITGLKKAQEGSGTYTRFTSLIKAMEVILVHLENI